jgi:hypothetical protein
MIDIRAHILNSGSRKWRQVRAKHSAIPETSWWRLVKSARQEFVYIDPIQSSRVLASPNSARIRGKNEREAAAMPMSTDEALVGSEALRVLSDLCSDAMTMRASALNADGSIRNPDLLERSIKLRCSVLVRAMKLKSAIYDNFRAGAFFGTVIDEIRLEAPEVSHRIVTRLRRLSATMT